MPGGGAACPGPELLHDLTSRNGHVRGGVGGGGEAERLLHALRRSGGGRAWGWDDPHTCPAPAHLNSVVFLEPPQTFPYNSIFNPQH